LSRCVAACARAKRTSALRDSFKSRRLAEGDLKRTITRWRPLAAAFRASIARAWSVLLVALAAVGRAAALPAPSPVKIKATAAIADMRRTVVARARDLGRGPRFIGMFPRSAVRRAQFYARRSDAGY